MKMKDKIISNLFNWATEVDLGKEFDLEEHIRYSNNYGTLEETDQNIVWLDIAAALNVDPIAYHLISNLHHAVVHENYEFISTMKADAINHIELEEKEIEMVGTMYFDELLSGFKTFELFNSYQEELVSIANLWYGDINENSAQVSDRIDLMHKDILTLTKDEVRKDAQKHLGILGLGFEYHPILSIAKLDRFLKLLR